VVPILSVVRINGQFFAFVASKESNGTFARQKVLKVGEPLGNDYPVLNGLQGGELRHHLRHAVHAGWHAGDGTGAGGCERRRKKDGAAH